MVRQICSWVLTCIFLSGAAVSSAVADNNVASLDNKKIIESKDAEKGKSSHLSFYVFNDKLNNVIAEMVRRDDISFKRDGNIKGTVYGKKLVGTRHKILKTLSREHDFDWFEYNKTLYVSNRYERSTKFFSVNAAKLKQYLSKLDEAGANLSSFQIQYIDKNTTSISGPPGYLAIVSTIIDARTKKASKISKTDYNVDLYKGVKLHKIELEKEFSE